jgi:hypothetical protein
VYLLFYCSLIENGERSKGDGNLSGVSSLDLFDKEKEIDEQITGDGIDEKQKEFACHSSFSIKEVTSGPICESSSV